MYEDILKIVEKYFGNMGGEDCECCAQEIAIKLEDPYGYKEIFVDKNLSYKAQLAKHSQPDPLDAWYREEN